MISKYKKVNIKNILLGTIIILVIGGIGIALNISKFKGGTPAAVAEEFVKNIYTVDEVKVAEYKKIAGQVPPGSNVIGEGIPKGTTTGPNEEYTKIADSLDKNIRALTTERAYEGILANQFNEFSMRICAQGNYTAEITDFTLGENVYGKNEDKVRYRYEVKLKFISSDGKSKEVDTSSGAVELLKEDGQWKVCMYTINEFPKLYK